MKRQLLLVVPLATIVTTTITTLANAADKPIVGAFVYSHEKDENVFIGALRFKGEDLVLSRKVASFVEVYGRRIPVSEIPKMTVTFGSLKVNAKPVRVTAARAIYPKNVPDYAEAIAEDGKIVIEVGQQVKDRQERTVRLIGEKE